MKAYGVDVPESKCSVTYGGRVYPIIGAQCGECGYIFFTICLPEHEPSFCPNCAMKFDAAVRTPLPR